MAKFWRVFYCVGDGGRLGHAILKSDALRAARMPEVKQVFLTTAYPAGPLNFGPAWLLEHSSGLEGYAVTEDPEAADIIVFVENHPANDLYFMEVRHHALRRAYPEKCVLYHDADRSVTPMRTIAPNVARWQYNPRSKATFHFLARLCENEAVNQTADFETERHWLFSFDGTARTNPIRKRVLALEHPRAKIVDRGAAKAWEMTEAEKADYQQAYVDGILGSHFVLCPAGIGPASCRLFETLQMGRPPVIIADQWIPVDGVDWDACSVRVRERDIEKLPAILEEREPEAVAMGRRAREVWERHFSPEVSLQRLCETADRLVRNRYGAVDWLRDVWQFLEPYHFRGLVRYLLRYRGTTGRGEG